MFDLWHSHLNLQVPLPISAWFFGDPHINTLDNLAYTFNGLGEYVLINTVNSTFTLQGRTARVKDVNGTLGDATVFSAFAAKDLTSDTVVVMMNDTSDGEQSTLKTGYIEFDVV